MQICLHTYPIIFFAIDTSIFANKVFYHVLMTLFSCDVQGSPLTERMKQRFTLLLLLFVLLDYVKLFVLVAIKSIHKRS